MFRQSIALTMLLLGATVTRAQTVETWKGLVRITPVLKSAESHSIHAYFVSIPESPDGKSVLCFTSTEPNGQKGEVCIIDRASGKVQVLAKNVETEDAHRAACQQWVSGGKRVVFHDLRDGQWCVVCIDLPEGKERILARDRHVGFGQPDGDLVPLVGLHWNPGKHTGLALLNVATGEIRTVVKAEAVREKFPELVAKQFGDRPLSLYFPVLGPNAEKVFFKLATPAGGDFRSKKASEREGLLVADLKADKVLWMHPRWGHPAWSKDGSRIINVGPVVIDAATGSVERIAKLGPYPGSHPSFAPDGNLFTTDKILDPRDSGLWSVVIGDLKAGVDVEIHRFDNSKGASSWRRSHPHPIFSHDGRRLYFNVSGDRWTRLMVAEIQ